MKTTLKITGMTCQNCVNHVRSALNSVAGVEAATVGLATGTAVVSGQTDELELMMAVRDQGYDAKVAE